MPLPPPPPLSPPLQAPPYNQWVLRTKITSNPRKGCVKCLRLMSIPIRYSLSYSIITLTVIEQNADPCQTYPHRLNVVNKTSHRCDSLIEFRSFVPKRRGRECGNSRREKKCVCARKMNIVSIAFRLVSVSLPVIITILRLERVLCNNCCFANSISCQWVTNILL